MSFHSREPVPKALQCSFCDKSQDVVSKLIASPGDSPKVYICDECIVVCITKIGGVPELYPSESRAGA
jgi:hypothetical protein